jgi:hypothetical protein
MFWGSVKLHDGNRIEWVPNYLLEMTPEQQFKSNLDAGHFDGYELVGRYKRPQEA